MDETIAAGTEPVEDSAPPPGGVAVSEEVSAAAQVVGEGGKAIQELNKAGVETA